MIWRDRYRFWGNLIFYISEQMPSKFVFWESIVRDIELILLEFTVKDQEWLCTGAYKPPSRNKITWQSIMSADLPIWHNCFDGDFKLAVENNSLKNFTKPTCFQSQTHRLFLTNKEKLFKNSGVIKVEISDHCSFILTALKSQLLKGNAKNSFIGIIVL